MSRLADAYYEWQDSAEGQQFEIRCSGLLARSSICLINALAFDYSLTSTLCDRDVANAIESLQEWQRTRAELRSRFGGAS